MQVPERHHPPEVEGEGKEVPNLQKRGAVEEGVLELLLRGRDENLGCQALSSRLLQSL